MILWGGATRGVAEFELGRFARLDPYVLWAVASGWRYQRQVQPLQDRGRVDGAAPPLRLLARTSLGMPAGSAGEQLLAPLRALGWDIPRVYDGQPWRDGDPVCFTASLPARAVPSLWSVGSVLPVALEWELAVPQREAETSAQANPLGLYGERSPAAYRLGERPFDEAVGRSLAPEKRPKLKAALAAVDFGGAFLHAEFRNRTATKTRLHALWDQGASPTGWHSWTTPESMQYGSEITAPVIDLLLQELRNRHADETDVYRELDHLIDYDDARRRIWAATHGTHVLHVAGGRHDPLLPHDTETEDPASDASLVFVQVPSLSAADCSGASMGAQLLDAVHYVMSQCEADAPVVINVSHGSYAGPMGGTSLIERALADLVKARPSLALVLAAGNARQRQGHQRRVVERDRSARLRLELVPGDSTPTFVEIWCDRSAKAAALARLRVRLRSAHGDWSHWVKADGAQFLCDAATQWPVAMVRQQSQVPTGDTAMALVAFAPTLRPLDDDGPLAQAGEWEIEVGLEPLAEPVAADPAKVAFDAWIERDDPGDFSAGDQPRFLAVDATDADESISNLCRGRNVFVVGGFRRSDGMQAPYSSVGTTEGWKIMGACEESFACPGVRAAAVRSGESFMMNGTSVAAPVVARRLFNWMVSHQERLKTGWPREALAAIVADEHAGPGTQAVKDWPD